MNWLIILITLFIGFILGMGSAFVFKLIKTKTAKELAEELLRSSEEQRKTDIDAVINNVKASFGSLSLEALSKSTEEFLKLAKSKLDTERQLGSQDLDAKKNLIEQQLKQMNSELDNVAKLMQGLEKDRAEKFGEINSHLKAASEETRMLMQTTNMLREALSSTKTRGQWGERMAEDVLRLAGFLENVNYLKQKAIENAGSRPDFTFLLPRNLKVNMDVKFPLDNYVKFLNTQSEADKVKFRNDFLKDVKARVKEITTREYINPEQNTVDYVLLFIPNEQIYAFIHEQDSSILDEGLKNRVVFCSPLTLYAILAIIRQAVDNFALEHTSNQILLLLGSFKKQWLEFLKQLEIVGKRIDALQKEYNSLASTRKTQLEKPLNKIEELRIQRDLPQVTDETIEFLPTNEEKEDSQ